MGKIILINLAKCAVRGIHKAMKDMFKIVLSDSPEFIREELSTAPKMEADRDECLALVTLRHKEVNGSGYIMCIISKKIAKRLLMQSGVVEKIDDELIGDAFGEFVTLIAGAFKQEMFNLGRGLIEISVPKKFTAGIDDEIRGVEVYSHYVMTVKHEKEYLMTIELAFQSTGLKEGSESSESPS